MDTRFTRAWVELRDAGPDGRAGVLRSASTRALIAALAGAQGEDARLANAVATELLNRSRRASFLGALVASVVLFAATLVVDALVTRTGLFRFGAPVTLALAVVSGALAILSGFFFALWRGRLPMLRGWILRGRG